MARRRRRAPQSAAMLTLVALALAACSTEPATPSASDASDSPSPSESEASDAFSPPQSAGSVSGTYDVDGRELFIECVGRGQPTMVLETGEGTDVQSMSPVLDAYKSELRVCSYDRANKGDSGTAPTPRGGKILASDLHGLLEVAAIPGPYVLVGQSAGGLLVQNYAATYPEDVAGVVAMNPVPPWAPWFTTALKEVTDAERRAETGYFGGDNAEGLHYRSVAKDLADDPVPKDVPFHLLISTVAQCDGGPESVCAQTYPAYEQIMKKVAGQWEQGRMSQVEAPHEIYLSDLDAVRRAIDDVLSRASSGS